VTIPISEVLEEAAREFDAQARELSGLLQTTGYIEGQIRMAEVAATRIRALAAEYKNCIVAEDTVIAWNRSVEFAGTGMGAHIPHDVEIPLYRAKELK
jgi:hypothetical protein